MRRNHRLGSDPGPGDLNIRTGKKWWGTIRPSKVVSLRPSHMRVEWVPGTRIRQSTRESVYTMTDGTRLQSFFPFHPTGLRTTSDGTTQTQRTNLTTKQYHLVNVWVSHRDDCSRKTSTPNWCTDRRHKTPSTVFSPKIWGCGGRNQRQGKVPPPT